MSNGKTSENIEVIVVIGVVILAILFAFYLIGPEFLLGPTAFFNPLLGFLVVAIIAIYVLGLERKRKHASAVSEGTKGNTVEITVKKHSHVGPEKWAIPSPAQPEGTSTRDQGSQASVMRWRMTMPPVSFTMISGLWIPYLLTIGFMVVIVYMIAASTVDQTMKIWGLAVSLLILSVYILYAAIMFQAIKRAAYSTGLMEFRVDGNGVSSRNLLTGAQQWGLYLMTWGMMGGLPLLLTKESASIRWGDIRSVEIDTDSLMIRLGKDPVLIPITHSISPILILLCTDENYPVVEEYVRRSLAKTSSVIETS
jgi:hypothetical protein